MDKIKLNKKCNGNENSDYLMNHSSTTNNVNQEDIMKIQSIGIDGSSQSNGEKVFQTSHASKRKREICISEGTAMKQV